MGRPRSADRWRRPPSLPEAARGDIPALTNEPRFEEEPILAVAAVDETFVVQATSHQTLETRRALAYWQNGKLFLHGSTQSTMRTHPLVASWVGVDPKDVVFISEYTGGGFGAKGGGAVSMCIPALLAKKANAPVMMRVSREDEHYIGHARTNMTGRARVGFRADGRITALDLFIVQNNGARGERGDHRAAGKATSLLYQPIALRWRRHRGPGDHEGGDTTWHRSRGDAEDQRTCRPGSLRSCAQRQTRIHDERLRARGTRQEGRALRLEGTGGTSRAEERQ